ncbi:Aminomethyltransferase [Streptomyces hirsutus]
MSSTELRRTALDALHRSLGATMTDFAGWDMPLRYGSERDEHNAVRTGAGLFDLSHMGEITVTGPQASGSSITRWSATSGPSSPVAPATP